MDVATLVLEFAEALAWLVVVGCLIVTFRRQIA
jgi:hypothetical protein